MLLLKLLSMGNQPSLASPQHLHLASNNVNRHRVLLVDRPACCLRIVKDSVAAHFKVFMVNSWKIAKMSGNLASEFIIFFEILRKPLNGTRRKVKLQTKFDKKLHKALTAEIWDMLTRA